MTPILWPHPPTEPRDQEHDMTTADYRALAQKCPGWDRPETNLLAAILDALTGDAAKIARYQADRLDEIHLMLHERLGKPTETRVEVHHPTYRPETGGIDLTPTEFADFLAAAKGEPVDVTEEPPVGSQVTDSVGDVWHRHDGGWTLIDDGEPMTPPGRRANDWSVILRNHAPLRLTTDADRERVGLPVDTAPDVDPDEALMTTLNEEVVRAVNAGEVEINAFNGYMFERNLARAAREHIYAEWNRVDVDVDGAQQDAMRAREAARAAEAVMLNLTRERDEARERLKVVAHQRDMYARESGVFSDICSQQQVRADAAEARYEALRADVEGQRSPLPWDSTRLIFKGILARDDERGRDA